MNSIGITGLYKNKNNYYTKNPKYCKGLKVYDERIIKYKGAEYRLWNPYRSKLSAAFHCGLKKLNLSEYKNILYLGAATGTTVSHISDINIDGYVYAVENSPYSLKKLLDLCRKRKNIIPIMNDAYHPNKYDIIVPKVDFIYQDISQRNQAEIFIINIKKFLKKEGKGIIMIKARSIDVSLKPKVVYDLVKQNLNKNKIKINEIIDISKYEKDHAMILISN